MLYDSLRIDAIWICTRLPEFIANFWWNIASIVENSYFFDKQKPFHPLKAVSETSNCWITCSMGAFEIIQKNPYVIFLIFLITFYITLIFSWFSLDFSWFSLEQLFFSLDFFLYFQIRCDIFDWSTSRDNWYFFLFDI